MKKKIKKNSSLLIFLGLIFLIVLAAFSIRNRTAKLQFLKRTLPVELQNIKDEVKQEVKDEISANFEFADIWRNRRGTYHCSYNYAQADMDAYMMDYYFADQKLAIFVDSNGQKMNTIITEDYTYSWTNQSPQGFKMKTMEDWDDESEDIGEDLSEYVEGVDDFDMTQFVCEKWDKDEKFFMLPEGMEFLSMEEMMMQ